MKTLMQVTLAMAWMLWPAHGEEQVKPPKPAAIPVFSPAKQPVVTGEFSVGLIVVTFKETAVTSLSQALSSLETVSGVSQEEYFKIYSNGIAWPKIEVMPSATTSFTDPQFYGYYCEYDYWENPMGWKTKDEGERRTAEMNKNALNFATKSYRGPKPRFICYNYVTTRPQQPDPAVTAALLGYYPNRSGTQGQPRKSKPRKQPKKEQAPNTFDPWAYYSPTCGWGDPMWPNSKMQINDFASSAFAHELGHDLGAPDVYHVGRHNDGISGGASLLAYGPTANAFSRFYHHAYIEEQNHPTLKTSGTYTLFPRHINPQKDEAVGFLIPSNHPHYMYHVEYIHKENGSVGVGPSQEGMLISVVNFGLESFLGSPDYFYVYRPNDPYFRGLGETSSCLFGKRHRRTEFNLTTEPSSRLPNLLDGGVAFNNIQEHDGTLTFDLVIDRKPVTGSAYTQSMLPQIQLVDVRDVQASSFTMASTIKFRGEPLKTAYGFCWSTSKNPTVRDSCYILAHRECYVGHATNLNPNTTYHVRAFATNGLGVRYSDEEKSVKTADLKVPPTSIGPLCTDSFSDNSYLYTNYSSETGGTGDPFIGYSPTCVLAKLIAYYRPAKFSVATAGADAKDARLDFNKLSWNPHADDFPMRLEEIDRFFEFVYSQSQQLKLHSSKPEKDFVKNIVKLTGIRSKPVLSPFAYANLTEAVALIRQDLVQSRPVVIVFAYDSDPISDPIRWALIDGINSKGELHVDFPLKSRFFTATGGRNVTTGYYRPADLIVPLYHGLIVTSAYYPK